MPSRRRWVNLIFGLIIIIIAHLAVAQSTVVSTTGYGNPAEWKRAIGGYGRSEEGNETHVNIRISGGPIRGVVSREAGPDRPTFIFKAIPMAEPPVGKLRFRPLEKKLSWRNELDATKYSPACLSSTARTRSPQKYISEDCIYMNVFTNSKCLHGNPCPVLFYIHGGAFGYGSATMFNDTQIVQKYASDGIVFMIPAYRLGVFGFLDLGNDRTVKRNLGMHDIIFALKWAKREARAFGGDPGRITVMGSSSGGSAVMYICASPAVKQDQFQQAIISSGIPFFTNGSNLVPTYTLLEHFNCTHSNRTGLPYSDPQKADCLRAVDALALLRFQQLMEEHAADQLFFVGPEMDSELMPASNYGELLKNWKARPVLVMTTRHEFEGSGSSKQNCYRNISLADECRRAMAPFGYESKPAFRACMSRYKSTFDTEIHRRVSYESMHAEAFMTALTNTRKGGESYVGEFELTNFSNHAEDVMFFIGLHIAMLKNPTLVNRTDVRLMDAYYPRMVKNFVRGEAPDPDWKPQDWNGRNYFRIAYNLSANVILIEWPHNVNGFQDLAGLDFWLREMAEVEWNASKGAEKTGKAEDTWQYVFGPKAAREHGDGLEKSEELGDDAGRIGFRFPILATMPRPMEMLGKGLEDREGEMGTLTEEDPKTDDGTSISKKDNEESGARDDGMGEAAGEMMGHNNVWFALWLSLTVAVILAMLALATTRKMKQNSQQRWGYSSHESGDRGNHLLEFTEKSHILAASLPIRFEDAYSVRYH